MTIVEIEPMLRVQAHALRDSLIPISQELQEAYGTVARDPAPRLEEHRSRPTHAFEGAADFST